MYKMLPGPAMDKCLFIKTIIVQGNCIYLRTSIIKLNGRVF